jgi:hypothetical protein
LLAIDHRPDVLELIKRKIATGIEQINMSKSKKTGKDYGPFKMDWPPIATVLKEYRQ